MLAIHKKHFVKQSKRAFFRFPNFFGPNNKLNVSIPVKQAIKTTNAPP
jgi:hypothetical protein